MSTKSIAYDQDLLNRLRSDDQAAFTLLFNKYYADMVRYVYSTIRDQDKAEELVQEVFVRFWELRHTLVISGSVKAYLLKAVHNQALDLLRHHKVRRRYAGIAERDENRVNTTEDTILYSELDARLKRAIAALPEPVSEVFCMSRMEALPYRDIAEKLGVSVRTVEVRVAKALSLLREELKDFFVLLLILIFLRF